MSFVVRTVTERAGGGDIVRTRRIDGNTARIGRGTDCEIHLADLAVQLHHATMTLASKKSVLVAAAKDARFEWNGRTLSEARFRTGDDAVLIFGSRKLVVQAGQEPDELVITISQMAGAGGAAEPGRLRAVFSPTLFSIRNAAWLLGIIIVLSGIVVPIGVFYFGWGAARIRPDEQWSPGPLSAGHRFLSHNCQACHQQAFVSVRDETCAACHRTGNRMDTAHSEAAARMRRLGSPFAAMPAPAHAPMARLLRARMASDNTSQEIGALIAQYFGHPPLRCAACHTEHVGAPGQKIRFNMPPRVSRAQLKNFDCVSCHRTIRERLPDSVVADTPNWSQHPQFRPLVLVAPKARPVRASLAVVSEEYNGINFSHWQHLHDPAVIDEAVKLGAPRYGAPLTCRNCHTPAQDGRSYEPVEMRRDCAACHDLTYSIGAKGQRLQLAHGEPDSVVKELRVALSSPMTSAVTAFRRRPGYVGDPYRDAISGERRLSSGEIDAAIRGTFQKGGLCYGCHAFVQISDSQSPAYRVLSVLRKTYRQMGAFLYFPWSAFDHAVPAHHEDSQGRPSCEACHRDKGTGLASYMTLPPVSECRACHGASPDATKTPASSDCMDCHGYHIPARPLSASYDALHSVRADFSDTLYRKNALQRSAQSR